MHVEQIKCSSACNQRGNKKREGKGTSFRLRQEGEKQVGRGRTDHIITHHTNSAERQAALTSSSATNGSTRSPCGECREVRERVPVVLLQRLLPPPHRGRGERLLLHPGRW